MRVLGIMFLLLCKKADAKREMKTTKEHNYQNFSIRTQSRIAIIRIQNPPFSFFKFLKGMDEIYSSTYDDYEWDDVQKV